MGSVCTSLLAGPRQSLVLAGGVTALPVALASEAHWLARAGFLVQALAWIALVMAAVRAIRRGDRVRHMWLMLAVAAIASGALWLRLATWAMAAAGAARSRPSLRLAAWLSWVLPLGIVTLLGHRNRSRASVFNSLPASPRPRQRQPHAAADEEAAAEPRHEAHAVVGEEPAGAAR